MNVRANFTEQQIADACRQFGPQVGPLPQSVNGEQLLWGMSGVESSFGEDCQPRHEPAFDVGGIYGTHAPMPNLLARFGSEGACSYGPWQLMICNAPLTYWPGSFDSLTLGGQATIAYLNQQLRSFKPKSLAEIGECWNAGHITPDPTYVERLAKFYAVPIIPVSA